MGGTLVIIPCGQAKVWDDEPLRGPTPADQAYTGAPFKVNRAYAERHGDRWVILSARYGFILPSFLLPGPYNVTFKKRATHPVEVRTLQSQISELGLDQFPRIIGLGGKEYRAVIVEAFGYHRRTIEFPFAGLPIGLGMQAIKKATAGGTAPAESDSPPESSVIRPSSESPILKQDTSMSMIRHRESVLKAMEEFDALGREVFLKRYGFGIAHRYFLVHGGKKYDSKAIVGVAHGFENPSHAAPLE